MASAGQSGMFVAIGHRRRSGTWQVPARYRVVAWMGGVALDLTDAELPVDGATVELLAVAGVITVMVPRAIAIEIVGDAVTWVIDPAHSERGASLPTHRGVVRIHGRSILGKILLRLRDPEFEPTIVLEGSRSRASESR